MKLLLWNVANHNTLEDSQGWDLSDLAQVNASLARDLDEVLQKALEDYILSHGDEEEESDLVRAATDHGQWIQDQDRPEFHNFWVFGEIMMVVHVKEIEIKIN